MPGIEGVYAAALTARRLGTQDVNLGAMWDLLDFLGERRVNGIALLGATGEFIHYAGSERMRVMGLAPKRSRVPVLVNVSDSTLDGAVELAQAAAASGAAGVLLMPPHFYRYDQETIRQYFVVFAEQSELQIPILIDNFPQFTNLLEIETAEWLLSEGIVQGVKDSSGDGHMLDRLLGLRQNRPFPLMTGSDALSLSARRRGSSGVISGVASAIPELLLAIDRAILKGVQETADALGGRLNEFLRWTEALPTPVGVKEAAIERGLKLGPHAVPLSPVQERIAGEFREWFKGWLPQVLNECKLV